MLPGKFRFCQLMILCIVTSHIFATTVSPISAVSRKTHGSSGTFDIPLTLTGTAAIECRSGGPSGNYTLVLTFASPVTFAGATVTKGTGSVASTSVNGPQVTINLTGVADQQRIVTTLSSVSDGTVTNDVSVATNMLIGDVNGDGIVNIGDTVLVRNQSGQAVTASNFREDVNADGLINATDVSTVRGASGDQIPCSMPIVTVISGQSQSAGPNSFLPEPIVVQATCETGAVLANVPAIFTADAGSFAAGSGDQTSPTLTVNTDQNGLATAYFFTPNKAGMFSAININVGFNGSTDYVQLSATTVALTRYAVIDLGFGTARALNSSFAVVGDTLPDPELHTTQGFVWQNGSATLLQGFDMFDINDNGSMVGDSRSADGTVTDASGEFWANATSAPPIFDDTGPK